LRKAKRREKVEMPVGSATKKIMRIADDEADKTGDGQIQPGHLMLGILLDEGSPASGLLRHKGAAAESILQESVDTAGPTPAHTESETAGMLTELSALVELLIKQGVFSRQELAEELANRYILPDIHFFFQAQDGIRDWSVTGVQTCALPI